MSINNISQSQKSYDCDVVLEFVSQLKCPSNEIGTRC